MDDITKTQRSFALKALHNPEHRFTDVYHLICREDGYQSVLSWGELDPQFGAGPVLVAWRRDGVPLGDGAGMAQLVVPDKA
jgi:hypothetical protein